MKAPVKQTLSYSVEEFAEATGMGITKVRDAIKDGRIIPSFWDSKPLITHAEGLRFLETLPAENPKR